MPEWVLRQGRDSCKGTFDSPPTRHDTLLLSLGDGDLLDAIEFLTEHGKRFELAVFTEGVSTDLQARPNRIYWINDFAPDVRRDPRASS